MSTHPGFLNQDRPPRIKRAALEIPKPEPQRVLIAVSSCWKDLRSNQAIRDTWAKYVPKNWDLRFFIGNRNFTDEEQAELFTPEWIGSPGTLGNLAAPTAKKAVIGTKGDLKNDEILLDCPDSYLGLPWKTVESLKWALAQTYDVVFRVFVDTYLFPDRLERVGFAHDCSGWSFGCGPCPAHSSGHHSCPLGGAGYPLSRKACEAVLYTTEEVNRAPRAIRHWWRRYSRRFCFTLRRHTDLPRRALRIPKR